MKLVPVLIFGTLVATPAALAAAIRQLFERVAPGEVAEQLRLARERYSWSAAAEATLAGYGLTPSLAGAA